MDAVEEAAKVLPSPLFDLEVSWKLTADVPGESVSPRTISRIFSIISSFSTLIGLDLTEIET
jgi:hypothetical protein